MEKEQKLIICDILKDFHTSAIEAAENFTAVMKRAYFITPKALLDLVNLYIEVLSEKRGQVVKDQETLRRGVQKIKETAVMVAQLKIDLTESQPKLEIANKQTEETLVNCAIYSK